MPKHLNLILLGPIYGSGCLSKIMFRLNWYDSGWWGYQVDTINSILTGGQLCNLQIKLIKSGPFFETGLRYHTLKRYKKKTIIPWDTFALWSHPNHRNHIMTLLKLCCQSWCFYLAMQDSYMEICHVFDRQISTVLQLCQVIPFKGGSNGTHTKYVYRCIHSNPGYQNIIMSSKNVYSNYKI